MTGRRRTKGDETWYRLLEWNDSQKSSERLAGQILKYEGFTSIDPSHPLGGPDGLKDLLCIKNRQRWVVSVHFPRGRHSFAEILAKFKHDIEGVKINKAKGFVFIINQQLSLGERNRLIQSTTVKNIDIFHLERISLILDTPINYGVRLDFLDIEMTKEEQVALFSSIISHPTSTQLLSEFEKFKRQMKREFKSILQEALKSRRILQ